MRKILLLLSFAVILGISANAQSLRKVKGVNYIGASYNMLSEGFGIRAHYDNYFKKNFAYSAGLSYENYAKDDFTLNNVSLMVGAKNFLSLPVNNMFIGGGYGGYFGKQYAKQELLSDKSNTWIFGLYLEPTLEYYVGPVSFALSYSQYFDFSNDFRDYHYSLNFGITYTL